MNKYVFILLCNICSLYAYSQELGNLGSTSQYKANLIIEKHLPDKIENKNYLLFSIKDEWYLIVIKNTDYFEKYFMTEDTLIIVTDKNCFKKQKEKKILTYAFDNNKYHNGYINLNSDFYSNGYEVSQGNTTYFYLKDKDGNVYGEANLTTIIKPNPIDNKVYSYLLSNLLYCIKEFQ